MDHRQAAARTSAYSSAGGLLAAQWTWQQTPVLPQPALPLALPLPAWLLLLLVQLVVASTRQAAHVVTAAGLQQLALHVQEISDTAGGCSATHASG